MVDGSIEAFTLVYVWSVKDPGDGQTVISPEGMNNHGATSISALWGWVEQKLHFLWFKDNSLGPCGCECVCWVSHEGGRGWWIPPRQTVWRQIRWEPSAGQDLLSLGGHRRQSESWQRRSQHWSDCKEKEKDKDNVWMREMPPKSNVQYIKSPWEIKLRLEKQSNWAGNCPSCFL